MGFRMTGVSDMPTRFAGDPQHGPGVEALVLGVDVHGAEPAVACNQGW